MIERPLKEWQERLPAKHFTRIHRSAIINLNEVERIESLFNRTKEVSLRSRTEPFTVSRRYLDRLKEKFG